MGVEGELEGFGHIVGRVPYLRSPMNQPTSSMWLQRTLGLRSWMVSLRWIAFSKQGMQGQPVRPDFFQRSSWAIKVTPHLEPQVGQVIQASMGYFFFLLPLMV